MNVLVVDTSSWISYLRGGSSQIIEVALREGRAYLTSVVAAELLSSFQPESQKSKFITFLKELPICDSSLEHWIKVGELRASLSKHGLSVSTPDAHIAQSALDLDGYLVSEDKIFLKIAKVTKLKLSSN